MKIKFSFKHPFRIFGWAFAALLLLLILLEGWRYAVKPVAETQYQTPVKTLDEVAKKFIVNQRQLLDHSQELANALQIQLQQQQPRQLLFESMQRYSTFWGAGLYQAGRPIVWDNFSLEPFQQVHATDQADSYVEVQKIDNVLLWIAHVAFTVQTENGPALYHLFTAKRIRQTNALPIGNDREYSFLKEISSGRRSSIHINIYTQKPAQINNYRILRSLNDDSVGIAYATANNLTTVKTEWHDSNRFWRILYAAICFIIIGLLLYLWFDGFIAWKGLLLQLLVIAAGWAIFNQIHIAEHWIPTLFSGMRAAEIKSYQILWNFSVNGIFALFLAFTLKRKLAILQFRLHDTSFISAILAALAGGLINMISIVFTLKLCYRLVYSTTIPLLNLQVFPSMGTFLFYLSLGISLLALTIMLLAINHFLLRSCEDQSKLVTAVLISCFIGSLFIAQLFISKVLILDWIFIIATLFFGLIFVFSYFYFRFPYHISTASPLRNAAIFSLIISLAGSTVIYQAKKQHTDAELMQTVQSFTQNKNKEAQALTLKILGRLQQEFKELTVTDLQDRLSFIQSRFTQTIEDAIPTKSRIYSFDLQLIDNNENILTDYSTNLNSPNWVHVFNLQQLKTVMNVEQITKKNNRPVVQQPELQNSEDYQTFYRGWVPLFGTHQYQPIAWILCSVYRERPNFNKPMRAVMASLNYQDWQQSYLIQQYKNRQLSKTTYQGVEAYYPVFNVLQPAEERALKQDSTIYFTNTDNQNAYRNLLVKLGPQKVIKGSTLLPGYQNILFSFFRLSFTLLVVGFIILLIFQSLKTGKFSLFKNNERFQYRILDSFLLATLIFLILLVFVTHFAIKQQNKDLVEQELFQKLETIAQATRKNQAIPKRLRRNLAVSLDSLATPLNVDASFYNGRLLSESTTPQIYQQHLLPATLPYPVYSNLFLSQKRDAITTVRLNGQELLIGYRSVLSDEGKPIATIAIPTFVQSPKFNKQLLQTTSYLIILYLLIFGLFVIGTTLISRQLTRPLYYIQQGLNKISRGNLDTTIPATSNDEIGSLATAYNKMVNRLKQLQEELATTEREAAWQEMAQQVAHEIKNPLTPMKLNIQHLERQMVSGDYTIEELKKKVKKITQNLIVQIQSLNNIASDFSKFSKPIEEEFTKVDITQLLDSVIDLYKHDEQTIIKTNRSAFNTTIYGAKDELRRAIINLVKNAREAMPDGGAITLKSYVRQNSIFIEIEDTGQGISEQDKPKIFVPNFSTKSSGTGLGLAICKKVVEAHGGSISFASIKDKGTTFVVKLPLC